MCSMLAWSRVPRLNFILFYKDQGEYPKISTPCQMAQSTVSNMDLDLQNLSADCGGKDNTEARGENRKNKVAEAGEHRATEGKPGREKTGPGPGSLF